MSAELTHQFEPELRFGLPRPARIKAQAWAEVRAIALIGVVVALVIGWFAARDLGDLYALRARGVTKEAAITSKRKVHGKSDSYYFAYTLRTSSSEIADEDEVSAATYEQKESGDTIPVTFLPEQPSTHRLGHVGEKRVRSRSVDWALGLMGGSGLLGLLAGAMLAEYRKELRLTRDGIPVAGIVSDCAAPPPNTKTISYTVTYRFALPDGDQTQTCFVSAEVGKQLAAEQTVTVLYDAADPRRSCLYCALRYTEVA